MIRKENERQTAGGRRPLLVTFVGNNRQMLNEIRDSLSHLRKNDLEGYSDFSNVQLKPEFCQIGSGLGGGNKVTRRDNQHHKALAEIRDSLRPYQNSINGSSSGASGGSSGGGSSDNSSTTSCASSPAASDAESSMNKVQNIMQYGFDEDIAVRALQLSGNHSVNAALRLLLFIMEEKLGGGIKCAGYPGYSHNQRPSFGSSSLAASETNSVRSDSPSVNSSPSQQQQQRPVLVNGLQTPPPIPPRVPITSQFNYTSQSQTPPASIDVSGISAVPNGIGHQVAPGQSPVLQTISQGKGHAVGMTQAGLLVPGQNHVIPQGHVQQLIQRMSPGQPYYHLQQKQQHQQQVTAHVNGGVRAVVNQRGVSPSPTLGTQQSVLNPGSNGSVNVPNHQLSQQLQNLMLGTQVNHSQTGPAPATSNGGSTMLQNHTQAPPPPYSQARLQVTTAIGLNGTTGGPPAHRDHFQDVHGVPSGLEVQIISVPAETTQVIQSVASTAVSATRMAMGFNHMPIIMPSVHSKEVTKPVPQTATAPVGLLPQTLNLGAGTSPAQLAQVQAHSNTLSPMPNQQLKHQHPAVGTGHLTRRDVPIPIIHSPHNGSQIIRNGGSYTLEQLAAVTAGQPTIQTFHNQWQSHFSPNHTQAFRLQNGTLYQQFPGDSNLSTSRSDSPVSRATNQSPMSVMSTTSSPSTNSDMPDKPPPPYPGRGIVNLGMPPHLNPPVLPPRVPLKDKPPPPPPPHVGHQDNSSQPGTQTHFLHLPPSYFSANLHHAQSCCSSSPPSSPGTSLVGSSSSLPLSLPISENSSLSLNSNTNSPGQPNVDNLTAPTEGCPHLLLPQMNRNAAPSETDETDTDTSSISQSRSSPSTKCSNCNGQEKHRCMSPLPERRSDAHERDRLRCDTKVKMYSPQAFKFYMEQHVENVLKSHAQRMNRRLQLEKEMAKVNLSEEAARQMRKMLHQKESNYIRLKRAKMDASMFEKIKTLGVGAFGEVALVRKKDVGSLYAMKTLKKSNVIQRNQVAHVKAERDILAEADNEWVVKLYYSFQDSDSLYFVMDYVPGGDLMGLLIRKEILEEHLAQFYIAELVLAIESVHRMGFIHRDIKPDNILIDKDGHIKLTDFGLCTGFRWTHNSKYYQKDGHVCQDSMDVSCELDDPSHGEILKPLEKRRQREQKRCLAHSLVGTPNYIAPEVLLRLGYTKACDWWSVGVILYEMVIGQPPFYAPSPAETQYKVINWKETLMVPHCTNISPVTIDLIAQLLQGPETRLGRNGATEVKEHKFFSGVNFEGLRKLPAPLKPTIKFLTDTSNFDPVDPDKLQSNDSDGSKKANSKSENGKHPEHAFFEFTFRRFFDDGGHPCSVPSQQEQETNAPVYV
ncbi:unnamed protein product [Candidula unifasciata]|uniref:non-specific serine/threonine protein kinase n=1 Tax=Candidula unifasciata TaxID=100452 RepID=A0A8S3ZJM7_9EUPU|nr:unnamed protein product [Candidula unifasciata]